MNNIRNVLLVSILFSSVVHAEDSVIVKVPVQVDHLFMRQVLVSTLFTSANESVRVFDDRTGCNFFKLQSPEISTVNGLIRIRADGKARFGQSLGNNRCLTLFQWKGKVESFEKLYIDDKRPVLKARVIKTNLLNENGEAIPGNDILWKNTKEYLTPKLESVVLDLAQVQTVLHNTLPLMLDDQKMERVTRIVKSLSLSDADVNEQGVKVSFALKIPPGKKRTVRNQAKPLTEQEMEKLDVLFQELDSFITVVIKKAAGDTNTEELRNTLLTVLLDTRHDIISALQSTHTTERDPVREVFLTTWKELAPVLRKIAYKQQGVDPGISYLSFVTAADALMAIDAVGGELGIDISSSGLKNLARILVPYVSNPLQWSDEVDPQLRKLFNFRPLVSRQSSWFDTVSSFFIEPAYAIQNLTTLAEQLNRWVPNRKELDDYLPLVEKLLRHSTQQTLGESKLKKQFHPIYQSLVLATAWQESCWRQYIKRRGKQVPLKSGVGAVGMMQVVPRVWRGFYNRKKLTWDIAYNIDAGSEILMRYLKRYAIRKKEHIKTGNPDNLARATYSAYNAGPGKLTRYRWRSASKRQKRVDNDFYERYLTMKENKVHKVASCY